MEWEGTCKRYIAVIDIMGLRSFIQKKDHFTTKEKMELFRHIALDCVESLRKLLEKNSTFDDFLKVVFFDNSLLIVSKDDSEFSLQNILLACQVFVASCIFKRIPVKGVVSYGTMTADFEESLFFGNALSDSSNMIDHTHMYGLLVDNRVEKRVQEMGSDFLKDYCLRAKTPTKSGLIQYYSVNWMTTATKISLRFPDQLLNGFYEEISGPDRQYLDNTMDFYNSLPESVKNSILNTAGGLG